VCGADTRLRHRVGLQGAIQRIYEAREHGKCGGGARNAPAPGRLKTWDAVAATLFGLLMGLKTEERRAESGERTPHPGPLPIASLTSQRGEGESK